MNPRKGHVRVGLVVAFAALGEAEEQAVRQTWQCAIGTAKHWLPAFVAFGLLPVTEQAREADVLVYLGESSRFRQVAHDASRTVPVILVKSTIEDLLERPPGGAPRYRMCTGVNGIARALASVAPSVPTVNWRAIPWPESVLGLTNLDDGERAYVEMSAEAYRKAALERKIPWVERIPEDARFSVFLTMHDPAAAKLAETLLDLWPGATVLAADGMVSTKMSTGQQWPERMIRVRHWVPEVDSKSNELFRAAFSGESLPDFDSAGMVFGTLNYLDGVLRSGGDPGSLACAGEHDGPLGTMSMTDSGQPDPERIVIFSGQHHQVHDID